MKCPLVSPRLSGSAGDVQTLYVVWPLAEKGRICDAYIAPDTASTKDPTDYITVAVKKSSTTLFSHSSADTALVAGTSQQMTAADASPSDEFSEGDMIKIDVAKAASGKAFGFTVALEVETVR